MEELENQEVMSKQDALKDKLRNRYPDQNFESDDDFSSRISDDYDDFDNQINGYKEREGKIVGLFKQDPRSEKFLNDWISGEDPRVSLMRSYGKEGIMAAFDDPEVMDKMAQADKEFIEMAAEEEELEKQYKQNLADSFEEADKLAQEEGYTDEQIDEATAYLQDQAKNIIMGKFTRDAIVGALHALNYDKDIETANHEGEVRGKNANIQARLRKPQGDGVPNLAGGGASASRPVPQVPGALGREKKSIYEAGGEKRTPVKREY